DSFNRARIATPISMPRSGSPRSSRSRSSTLPLTRAWSSSSVRSESFMMHVPAIWLTMNPSSTRASRSSREHTEDAMAKAIWNGAVLAESNKCEIVEGNHYFPPDAIKRQYFKPSAAHTTCPWKGEASYYDGCERPGQQGRRLVVPIAQGRGQEHHWLCRLLERRQGRGLGRTVKRLAGKIAIVTGSSSGIGKAIALTFGKEGAAVVIAARRKDLCEKTVAQIRKEGGDAMTIQTK